MVDFTLSDEQLALRELAHDFAQREIRPVAWELDRDAVAKAARGSGQFVVAIGFSYSGVVWRDVWPRVMANFVAACRTTGARMVFMDNLYMYGPQTTPLIETMALSGPRRALLRPGCGWPQRPQAKRV